MTHERDSGPVPETLLLVEDNAEARTALRRALEWHGFTVIVACDATEAETLFRDRGDPIGLVVADIVLPDRSGVDLARRLARIHPGLRVLFLSGYALDDLSLDVDGLGPSGFLEKPVTIRRLGNEVRRLLDAPGTPPPSGPDGGRAGGLPRAHFSGSRAWEWND